MKKCFEKLSVKHLNVASASAKAQPSIDLSILACNDVFFTNCRVLSEFILNVQTMFIASSTFLKWIAVLFY